MILPIEFWNAFNKGIYPQKHNGKLSYEIKEYAKEIEKIAYVKTLYNDDSKEEWEFFIDIVAIKNIAYISIRLINNPKKVIGIIHHNLRQKIQGESKSELVYFKKNIQKFPRVYEILQQLKQEFLNKAEIKLKEKIRTSGKLQFEKPIKIIICCSNWKKLSESNSALSSIEKAEKISLIEILRIDPTTISDYTYYSPDNDISSEALKASFILKEKKKNITKKWLELEKKNPSFTHIKITEKIAKKLKIKPISVASYGEQSNNKRIKSLSSKLRKKLTESHYQITEKWLELEKSDRSMKSLEIVEEIAKELGIKPISVTIYGSTSENERISSLSRKLKMKIAESNHKITKKWLQLEKSNPSMKPLEIIEEIAKKLGIKPISVAGYGSSSIISRIRFISGKLRNILSELRYEITEKWLYLEKSNPSMTPIEIIEEIAKDLNIKPISVSIYGRTSKNEKIRLLSGQSNMKIAESNYKITKRWIELEKSDPSITYIEIIEEIAKDLNIKPITVSIYGKSSKNENIRTLSSRYCNEMAKSIK